MASHSSAKFIEYSELLDLLAGYRSEAKLYASGLDDVLRQVEEHGSSFNWLEIGPALVSMVGASGNVARQVVAHDAAGLALAALALVGTTVNWVTKVSGRVDARAARKGLDDVDRVVVRLEGVADLAERIQANQYDMTPWRPEYVEAFQVDAAFHALPGLRSVEQDLTPAFKRAHQVLDRLR